MMAGMDQLTSLFLLLLILYCSESIPQSAEYKLHTHLMANYSPNVRPVLKSREAVNVTFEFKLVKIVELDIKEQQIVVNAQIMMRWHDPSLVWKKALYDDISYMNIPMSKIWTPDILLYNTASEASQGHADVYKASARVENSGRVIWQSPVTLRSSCVMDVKWFPFDKQSCTLTFGSISLTKEKLDLTFHNKPNSVEAVKSQVHFSNGIWTLKTLVTKRVERAYSCCKEPFSLLSYTATVERMPLYWVLYIILPCLCLSAISMCVFYIPAESGERIGFSITVVLAMSVYLLVISDKLPEKGDNKPLLGLMYITLFMVMIFILISVIFTTHLAYKITKPPKRLLHLFCKPCYRKKKKTNGEIKTFSRETIGTDDIDMVHVQDMSKSRDAHAFPSPRVGPMQRRQTIERSQSVFSEIDEKELKYQEQWRSISERIDNFMFWFFLILDFGTPFVIVGIYTA